MRDAARVHAGRIALRWDAGAVSYTSLMERVEVRAGALHSAGVEAERPVAFLAHRDEDFVVTMLALSRLGAPFAAFDAEYPASRLAQQAESLGVNRIYAAGIGPTDLPDGQVLSAAGIGLRHVMDGAAGPSEVNPPAPADDLPAYYLFTSGTTGTPKRIGVGHAALPHFLDWQSRKFEITCDDRVSLLSGLGHDPVMRDVFLPLTNGATLTIPAAGAIRDPRTLGAWLRSERPSVIHTTPAMGRLLSAEHGAPRFPGSRLVFWGGDMLPGDLVAATRRENAGLTQVNFYGASETPQAVLYDVLSAKIEDRTPLTVPVGVPTEGTDVRIIGSDGGTRDWNEVGQVRILTPYLVSVAGRTAEGDALARQIYDTGDMGYFLPDGRVMLAGRSDDQVSIRGYRVELGDLERQILSLPDVAQACVLPWRAPDGQTLLVAHVVTAHDGGAPALRRALVQRLPGYMVPTHVFLHDSLPLLPNGKRDRRPLLERQSALIEGAAEVAAGTNATSRALSDEEHAIAEVFSGALGRPVTDAGLSFVDLGADSLNAIQAMLQLERLIPDLPEDWPDQSVAELAGLVAPKIESDATQHWTQPFSLVQGELPVIFRALAIVMVVALHYHVGSIGGGMTAILFMLAGHSLVRFQLPKILGDGSAAPIRSMILRVLLLTVPVTLIVAGANFLQGDAFEPASVLLYANFLDYAGPFKAATPPSSGSGSSLAICRSCCCLRCSCHASACAPWCKTTFAKP